jgi:adenylate kinase family enzyme
MSYLWVTLLGGPGAGKTTVGQALESGDYQQFGEVHYISGSRLLDDYIADARDDWQKIERDKAEGNLADQVFVHQLLGERIDSLTGNGVVALDGFPKSLAQVELTDERLPTAGGVDLAVFLDCDAVLRTARIVERLVCDKCNKVLAGEDHNAPATRRCSDGCDGELVRREDDDPRVLEHREATSESVELLVRHFRDMGRLADIDATRGHRAVLADVVVAIGACFDKTSAQSPG